MIYNSIKSRVRLYCKSCVFIGVCLKDINNLASGVKICLNIMNTGIFLETFTHVHKYRDQTCMYFYALTSAGPEGGVEIRA